MVKRWHKYSTGAVFLAVFIGCCLIGRMMPPSQRAEERNTELWFSTYEQGRRSGSFSSCDATTELIFFAYSEKTSLIDAYDNAGNFQFTLYFEDKPNGVLKIRCENELLYVSTKSNGIFVFDGSTEVQRMTHLEATESGYTNAWFDAIKTNLLIEDGYAYITDEFGDRQAQFKLSHTIRNGISYKILGKILMLILVSVIVVSLTLKDRRRKGDGLRRAF